MNMRIGEGDAMRLKQPAMNRDCEYFYDKSTGHLFLDGKCFSLASEAEKFLEGMMRTDTVKS